MDENIDPKCILVQSMNMHISFVGTTENNFEELARNECPLIFAGEHTRATDGSSVHGAYLSGLRAAG